MASLSGDMVTENDMSPDVTGPVEVVTYGDAPPYRGLSPVTARVTGQDDVGDEPFVGCPGEVFHGAEEMDAIAADLVAEAKATFGDEAAVQLAEKLGVVDRLSPRIAETLNSVSWGFNAAQGLLVARGEVAYRRRCIVGRDAISVVDQIVKLVEAEDTEDRPPFPEHHAPARETDPSIKAMVDGWGEKADATVRREILNSEEAAVAGIIALKAHWPSDDWPACGSFGHVVKDIVEAMIEALEAERANAKIGRQGFADIPRVTDLVTDITGTLGVIDAANEEWVNVRWRGGRSSPLPIAALQPDGPIPHSWTVDASLVSGTGRAS